MIIPASELSITDYHRASPQWLSKTSINHFRNLGPAWWKLCYLDKLILPPAPGGVELGRALDCYLTEGEQSYVSSYAVKPRGMSFATKEGKAWKADYEDNGYSIITEDDSLILLDMVAAVRALPCWGSIEASMAQPTIRYRAPGSHFGLQSRPDWLHVSHGIYRDLKSTRDLSRFGTQAIDLGYHIQSALCGNVAAKDGIIIERSTLVAVESERGARAREYIIPEDVLSHAWKELEYTCGEIARRMESNDWAEIQAEPEPLDLPPYLRRQLNLD